MTLNKLDADIEHLEDRLNEKAGRMDLAARQQAMATLKTLRKERKEVAEWTGDMRHSSTEIWQHIKKGLL